MKRGFIWGIGALLVIGPAVLMGQAIKPTNDEITQMRADIEGSDAAKKDAAVKKAMTWLKGGYVSDNLWRYWVPALVKDGRHQDVADMCIEGVVRRPDPAAAVALIQARLTALVALKRNDEALQAAKSYFNIIEMKNSARGVDSLGTALGRAHPEDLEIVRKFRAEQSDAAAGKPAPAESVLKDLKVDQKPYETALNTYKGKTVFRDHMAYGDLLLLADQGAEAEKVFREIYQSADGTDQLTQSVEGIAKAIRAQDGNPVRAAAWFKMMSDQLATQAATQPATTPAAASRPTAASRPARPDPNLP